MSQNSNKYDKQYYLKNRERLLEQKRLLHKKYPWRNCFRKAKYRCICLTNKDYKYYGGRGIKFLLTLEEIKHLWFRDKAYLMKRPTIDRRNNNGNYKYSNCRFIENSINCARRFNKG